MIFDRFRRLCNNDVEISRCELIASNGRNPCERFDIGLPKDKNHQLDINDWNDEESNGFFSSP